MIIVTAKIVCSFDIQQLHHRQYGIEDRQYWTFKKHKVLFCPFYKNLIYCKIGKAGICTFSK